MHPEIFLRQNILNLVSLSWLVVQWQCSTSTYHNLCASLFLDKTDLTSETNLRASKTGNKLSRAVSDDLDMTVKNLRSQMLMPMVC